MTEINPIHHSFSEELNRLLIAADGKAVSLGRILEILSHRGDAMFLILINVPFILPIPAFGLSVPVGIAVAMMGWCLMFNRRLWLPARLKKQEISFGTLTKTVNATIKVTSRVEKLLKPRWKFMLWPGALHLVGLELLLAGLWLSLPLPIPATNFISAVIILPLALGLLEEDGVFIAVGHLIALGELIAAFIFWQRLQDAFIKYGHRIEELWRAWMG